MAVGGHLSGCGVGVSWLTSHPGDATLLSIPRPLDAAAGSLEDALMAGIFETILVFIFQLLLGGVLDALLGALTGELAA